MPKLQVGGYMRWIGFSLLMVTLAASEAAAQSSGQFDLVCVGTKQEDIDAPAVPHRYGFRVDIEANRWCWDHCERTFPIADVGPERLVLRSEDTFQGRGRYYTENTVSRVTGEHELVSINTTPPGTYYRVIGACEAAPFSGFPAARF